MPPGRRNAQTIDYSRRSKDVHLMLQVLDDWLAKSVLAHEVERTGKRFPLKRIWYESVHPLAIKVSRSSAARDLLPLPDIQEARNRMNLDVKFLCGMP